jgi:enoyl-CoA hydratase/carnithine racemase
MLATRIDEIDDEIRVVVLRGEGAAFCAGADLGDVPDTPMAWRDRIVTAQSQHLRIINMKQTVVAAVQGAAFGGGASLALAADILVMDENASLGFPFVKLGVVPDGGASFLLQAKASPAIALDVLLTGGVIKAEEARVLGLTRRVAPAGEAKAYAMKLAEELAALPAEALLLTKSLCGQAWAAHLGGALRHEADAFGLATASEGHRSAMAAAKAKLAKVK